MNPRNKSRTSTMSRWLGIPNIMLLESPAGQGYFFMGHNDGYIVCPASGFSGQY